MFARPRYPVRSRKAAPAPARMFESATAEVIAQPTRLPQRATLYLLVAFVTAVMVFISVAKLDRIVKAQGRLSPIAGTLTVQPLEKAIINHILVSVGDVVKAGQVLATCDPTFAQADLTQLQQKIASLQAQLRRMQAEDAGKELPPAEADAPYELVQASIWRQRQIEYQAGVSDFDQRINSTQAQLVGLRQSVADFATRLEFAQKKERMNLDLAKDGYVSQIELLTSQDQRVALESSLSQSRTTLDSTQHLLESLKEQRKQFIDKWHEENLVNLASTKDALDAAQQEVEKFRKVSQLVNLTSPADAVVIKVPNLSSGAIAPEALPLFSLVPLSAPLEVDVQIESQDIGFVKVGDAAVIKLDAYKFLEHGTGTGIVKTISEDSFTEASSQDAMTSVGGGGGGGAGGSSRNPFFDARIKITSIKLHDVPPNFRISAGMTVQTDIVVGSRTIMWYLLGGALRSGSEAMKEP
jgi:membrane fusion protein, hemolysin D